MTRPAANSVLSAASERPTRRLRGDALHADAPSQRSRTTPWVYILLGTALLLLVFALWKW